MKNRIIGPVVTILATILYHLAVTSLGVAMPTVAWITPLVAWSGFASGLRAGVLAGVWAGLYSFYLTGDLLRAGTVGLSLALTGAIIGYRTRLWRAAIEALEASVKAEKKARLAAEYNQSARNFVDSINGGKELLDRAVNLLRDEDKVIGQFLDNLPSLPKPAIRSQVLLLREELKSIRHMLNELFTHFDLWQQLAMIRELIIPPPRGPEKTEPE